MDGRRGGPGLSGTGGSGGGGHGGYGGGGGGGAGWLGAGTDGGPCPQCYSMPRQGGGQGAASLTVPGSGDVGGAGGYGGGGGGGYNGGGGGGGFSGGYGGGGGGSYLAKGFTTIIMESGVQHGNGYVTISSVPEPSTWALMAVGFGTVGFLGIRRGKLKKAIG